MPGNDKLKVEWFEVDSIVFKEPIILLKEQGMWVLKTSDENIVAQGNSINEVCERFVKTVTGQLFLDLEDIKNATFE